MTEHPITPPPELVTKWWGECTSTTSNLIGQLATLAARWGSDLELEACKRIAYERGLPETAAAFQRIRRPKPLSLKELALEQLECIQTDLNKFGMGISTDTIRRALEQLDE